MSASLHVVVLPLEGLALLAIAAYSWRQPDTPGARAFALMNAMLVVWLLGDLGVRLSDTFAAQLLAEKIKYLGVATAPVLLLESTLAYVDRAVSARWRGILFAVPAATLLMVWTNEHHGLFWQSLEAGARGPMKLVYGQYFWGVHLPWSYAMLVGSITLLIRELIFAPRFYRRQLAILAAAICIPIVANVAHLTGLTGGESYTTLSFGVLAITMAWGLFRHRLMKSNPIAYATVFRTIKDSVLILDRNDLVTDVNPAAARALNRPPESLIGQPAKAVLGPWPELLARLQDVEELHTEIRTGPEEQPLHLELSVLALRGAHGRLDGRVITARDITARKLHRQTLEGLAFRDALTQIPNRRRFQDEATRALAAAKEQGRFVAILYFDIDKFKAVNDAWGHDVGDELLKYVSARVGGRLRQPDFLARLGGDEFAVLLHGADRDAAAQIAERMLESVARPYRLQGRQLDVGLSIGIALYPEHGADLAELLRNADAAMYAVKANGGGYGFYPPPSD